MIKKISPLPVEGLRNSLMITSPQIMGVMRGFWHGSIKGMMSIPSLKNGSQNYTATLSS
jgi:hypothetical protein